MQIPREKSRPIRAERLREKKEIFRQATKAATSERRLDVGSIVEEATDLSIDRREFHATFFFCFFYYYFAGRMAGFHRVVSCSCLIILGNAIILVCQER